MKITILSDGGWGTALAISLVNNGHDVTQWGAFPEYLETIKQTRVNNRFLSGIRLPDALILETDIAVAVSSAEIIILATPSQYLRSVLNQFKPFFNPTQHLIVNVAKGIENDSGLRMSQVTQEILGECRYAALSGPSHAEEVARQIPTAVVVASLHEQDAKEVQKVFMSESFRVYTSNDLIGVELGGALKNIFAVAAGIIDGMSLGDNPKAALMTRAIAEMARLGVALGGTAETFSGLSGIGDLIVTCCSGHSRNRHVGECLGKGQKLDNILHDMGMVVAEGIPTCRSAWQLAQQKEINTPLIDMMYAILYQSKKPKEAIKELMTRQPRSEKDHQS